MSYDNPTPLRVGASGTLNGWRVQVAGRMVMGVEVDGETYYWNEYVLEDASGNSATLVYEETENGPEWKLFRAFTPTQPMSAREAATKRVGDAVNLDGTPTRITLVDESRVYHIEGRAPEGVEIGDVAHYFNADTGSRMLVASWTGDEIEFYEGLDAPGDQVAAAFGFPPPSAAGAASFHSPSRLQGAANPATTRSRTVFALVLFGLVVAFSVYSCSSTRRALATTIAPRAKLAAPTRQLATGAEGALARHSYRIQDQAVVEIARVAGRHDRREYRLIDETNQTAVLVNALSGGAKEWHLLRPVPVPADLSPFDAATKRKGAPIAVEGRVLRVTDLFQAKTVSAANAGKSGASTPALVQYGFVAQDSGDWLVARWTEDKIEFLRGAAIGDAEVIASLGNAPLNKK